jgi:hypothetical protein
MDALPLLGCSEDDVGLVGGSVFAQVFVSCVVRGWWRLSRIVKAPGFGFINFVPNG